MGIIKHLLNQLVVRIRWIHVCAGVNTKFIWSLGWHLPQRKSPARHCYSYMQMPPCSGGINTSELSSAIRLLRLTGAGKKRKVKRMGWSQEHSTRPYSNSPTKTILLCGFLFWEPIITFKSMQLTFLLLSLFYTWFQRTHFSTFAISPKHLRSKCKFIMGRYFFKSENK